MSIDDVPVLVIELAAIGTALYMDYMIVHGWLSHKANNRSRDSSRPGRHERLYLRLSKYGRGDLAVSMFSINLIFVVLPMWRLLSGWWRIR